MKKSTLLIALLILMTSMTGVQAQFQVDGQYFARSEYRNGYGRPISEGADPAFFIAHRARIQAAYTHQDVKFYLSVQDIRTWGSTPQLNTSDDFLSVHEAWVEVNFNPNWTLKAGRQELNYDNFRFLGNVDWAFQGRSHDLVLIKYEKEQSKLHLGTAFNQQQQRLSETNYELANQYKTAQFIRYQDVLSSVNFSLLFWNEGREKDKKQNFRQTFGISDLTTKVAGLELKSFFYAQSGKDIQARSVSTFDLGIDLKKSFVLDSAGVKKIEFAFGGEWISGSKQGSAENNSFSPLYGTNHFFNGYMDYFFVGGAFENSVGLEDFYLKARYTPGSKFWIQSDLHHFSSQQDFTNTETLRKESYLGIEWDLSAGILINQSVSVQLGYSRYWGSDGFHQLFQNTNPKGVQDWAYAMLIVRPTIKNKFIGVRI